MARRQTGVTDEAAGRHSNPDAVVAEKDERLAKHADCLTNETSRYRKIDDQLHQQIVEFV
jgi:hypothetical protein